MLSVFGVHGEIIGIVGIARKLFASRGLNRLRQRLSLRDRSTDHVVSARRAFERVEQALRDECRRLIASPASRPWMLEREILPALRKLPRARELDPERVLTRALATAHLEVEANRAQSDEEGLVACAFLHVVKDRVLSDVERHLASAYRWNKANAAAELAEFCARFDDARDTIERGVQRYIAFLRASRTLPSRCSAIRSLRAGIDELCGPERGRIVAKRSVQRTRQIIRKYVGRSASDHLTVLRAITMLRDALLSEIEDTITA